MEWKVPKMIMQELGIVFYNYIMYICIWYNSDIISFCWSNRPQQRNCFGVITAKWRGVFSGFSVSPNVAWWKGETYFMELKRGSLLCLKPLLRLDSCLLPTIWPAFSKKVRKLWATDFVIESIPKAQIHIFIFMFLGNCFGNRFPWFQEWSP